MRCEPGRFILPEHYLDAAEVANTAGALCCGWLDGMNGQVLTMDRGTTFFDNTMRLFDQRDRLGI